MLISLNWINDFVDLGDLDPEALAHTITMSSAEVESVTRFGGDIEGIVVGRIVECRPHPERDRLTLARVDIGGEIVESVCGAPNCREGLLTPFCKAGGRIQGAGPVEARQVAGCASNGVCCAPDECGLGETHDTIVELDEGCSPGDDFKLLAGIDDAVIDIDNKSLTHRPDLWGHYGFAREIAALLDRPLKPLPRLTVAELSGKSKVRIPVRVDDPEGCPRYSCIKLANLVHASSPVWMQVRLHHCGLRGISLAVDLTNYVLLELGQPMHAFDADKISLIRVDSTREPIRFRTLDDIERAIPAGVLMIYDDRTPVALAGIMGGGNSEVTENTTAIVLESANFNAYRIRRGTIEIGHRTDSSARFEKSLDPALTVIGIGRFAHLLQKCQPQVEIASELEDVNTASGETPTIRITKPEIDRAVGADIPAARIEKILNGLELATTRDGDTFTVRVPGFRATRDISIPADIVEEVARIYGYDNVQPQTPTVQLEPYEFNRHRLLERAAKRALAQRFGFSEVHTYAWYDDTWMERLDEERGARDGMVVLANPPAPESARLRRALAPNLLAVAQRNQRRADRVAVFELGSVFAARGDACDERKSLGLVLADRDAKQGHDALFFELKGSVEWLCRTLRQQEAACPPFAPGAPASPWVHPGKGCWIDIAGTRVGYFGLARPELLGLYDRGLRLALAELDFDLLATVPEGRVAYRPIPRFPIVDLDFSLLVDAAVRYAEVRDAILAFESDLLRSATLVDVYTGKNLPEGKKSLSFRVLIGSDERTLKGEEIEAFTRGMIAHLEARGCQVRAA